MSASTEIKEHIVVKFAGDSGDGMQLTGSQFTTNTALRGNDLATFPDFPAEIRAPQGTLAGVSGFQIHFSSKEIYTAGDEFDVLVAMNAAALKKNIEGLKKNGVLIIDEAGFDAKNLKLSGYGAENNPLDDDSLEDYRLYKIEVTRLTKECLIDIDLDGKTKDRSKNMFVLGFVYWLNNRTLENTIEFLNSKFRSQPNVLKANLLSLKAGYHYGETTEAQATRFDVEKAALPEGTYRNIMGNQATAIGLITASVKSKLPLFYGSYPITPASDILHELAKHKSFGVKTFQAEDEIAAASAAIGASFAGNLGVCATSGPGMALKAEAIGLAVMFELPLVICNVQRAGPSTGMPTKTEQADLLQAMYGRNGECPLPIVAAKSPSDCFEAAIEACEIAIKYMTPVIFLSDGYIANGAEPWRLPDVDAIEGIDYPKASRTPFLPYKRDENLVREWAFAGEKDREHRLGGLEKEKDTGNVSYVPENHEAMVKIRAQKVENVTDLIGDCSIDSGVENGDLLVLGWGSTYGSIKSAVADSLSEGKRVAHLHLRHLNPFPKNLEQVLRSYKKVLVPEMNNGQLVRLIRDRYLIDAKGFNKIQGIPFTKQELIDEINKQLNG